MADNDPNKLFLAKLGGQNNPTLRILLSKRKTLDPAPIEVSNRRYHKGTTYRRRPEDEIIGRRKDGLVLNFWDLGHISIGVDTWADLDWTYTYAVPTNGFGIPDGNMDFDMTGWGLLKDKIFEVPLDDWPTTYRKLTYEKAERYGIDVYTGVPGDWPTNKLVLQQGVGRANSRYLMNDYTDLIDGSHWIDGQGLVYPTSQANVRLITQSAFNGFGRMPTMVGGGNSPEYKITTVDDPDAPAASFTWSGNVDVFLVPRPVFILNTEQTSTDTQHVGWMGMLFTIQSRDIWLDMDDLYTYWQGLLGPPSIGAFSFDWLAEETTYPAVNTGFEEYKFYLDSTYIRVTDGTNGFTTSPLTFPALVTDPNVFGGGFGAQYMTSGYFATSFNSRVYMFPGVLLAMLKKNETWYYVWSTETIDPAPALITGFSFLWHDGTR